MEFPGLVKDVLLLSKARSEVVAEQMARRVPHEVHVLAVRRDDVGLQVRPDELHFGAHFGDSRTHVWSNGPHLWNPITGRLELQATTYHVRETGARNALVARGYVEVPGENGQPSGYGRFEALIPVRELQRIYMRPAKRARPNPSDIES